MDLRVATDIEQAAQLEQEGQLEQAAKLYEDAIKLKPTDERPYNRLMIIYRKFKQPKDELRVIKAGIAAFQSQFIRRSRNKKLTDLSNAMMKTSGLSDKKGKQLYYPEPLNKWMKRKELVEKKLEKDV